MPRISDDLNYYELNPAVPEVDLRITVTPVVAKPRKLNATWGPKRRYIDVVERLAAIEAGKPDPGEWGVLGDDLYGEKRGPEA